MRLILAMLLALVALAQDDVVSAGRIVLLENSPGAEGSICAETAGDFAFAEGRLWVCLPSGSDRVWASFVPTYAAPSVLPPGTSSVVRIYVSPSGSGTVTSSPILSTMSPLDWSIGSYQGFGYGVISFTAVPAAGYRFVRWYGVASTSNPLLTSITTNITLQATFERSP